MMSSPDTVSRSRRVTSGGFGKWGPAIGILGSFRPDVWAVLVVLCTWLFIVYANPPFVASNAMPVFTGASLGCLVGRRIGQLGVWPGGILVPRYTGTLFVLGVSGVVVPTLLAGLVSWSLGNAVPAVAPALLVGAAMMRHAIRHPSAVRLWLFILVSAALWGGAGFAVDRQPLFADAASILSHAWTQVLALMGTCLVVPGVYRALARETTVFDRSVWSPSGLGNSLLEDRR